MRIERKGGREVEERGEGGKKGKRERGRERMEEGGDKEAMGVRF
jgi:hypothetical protein